VIPGPSSWPQTPRPAWRRWRWGAAALAAALFGGLVAATLVPVSPGSHARQRVVVPSGAGALGVGQALAGAGVVRSGLLFALLAEALGSAHRLEAGTYLLGPGESPVALVRQVANGDVAVHVLTIVPGMTVAQAAAAMQAARLFPARQFLAYATGASPPPDFAERPGVKDPLEGFLAPATYRVPIGATVAQVAALLRAQFERAFTAADRARARRLGLSPLAVLTLASIVEREASGPATAPRVAAVFLNRLRRHMPLQSDATVLYALGGGSRLTAADLRVRSPYNTYRVTGLPPGPICNPGPESIAAVLHAAHTGDLYFATLPDGRMVFSRTYAGQQRALRRATDAAG
jgi:UPF0755 protein